LRKGPSTESAGAAVTIPGSGRWRRSIDLESYLESIERRTIEKALEQTRWNKTAAARKLGVSFRALRYKLKKLGME